MSPQVSLVIPVRNERDSLGDLLASIEAQTLFPDEVIIVDGGSNDDTVEIASSFAESRPWLKVIEAGDATPGRGRNVGIEAAQFEWIALTDAGLILAKDWLENLTSGVTDDVDIIYGRFDPFLGSRFDVCATFAYVSPIGNDGIRARSVASMMLRKDVWQSVGGFPDLRAAEDLMFMEAAAESGFKSTIAPEAKVTWKLRAGYRSTYQKFVGYSEVNARAGRAWDWHYGVAKQYAVLIPVPALAIFHSVWWLVILPIWLFARTFKRMIRHRNDFPLAKLIDPVNFVGVASLVLLIDLATFVGWYRSMFDSRRS